MSSTKLKGLRSLLFWSFIISLTGCTRNPQEPNQGLKAHGFGIESSRRLARQNIKSEFVELTNIVAERAPRVIAKMLANDRILANTKFEVGFAELRLDADLPRFFTTDDNRVLEVTLEQAQPCNVKPLTPSSPIIFAADPDRFESDEEDYVCKGLLVENGVVKPISFTLAEYVNKLSHIPLYFVGYQELNSTAKVESTSKGSLSQNLVAAPGGSVACHKIHMKKDHDPWNNEECEVYIHPPTTGGIYNNTTDFVFDGERHPDARNRNVIFPDVNNTSTIYICADLPVFFTLLGANQGFVAIEDDEGEGRHNRDVCQYGGCTPYNPYFFDAAVDVRKADGNAIWGTSRRFIYDYIPGINSDDILQSGCYEQFNLNWQPEPGVDVQFALNHNEFWLQRVFF